MTQTELTYLFNHPSQISENHLDEIDEILTAFPYFQAPRVIQLKGFKNTDSFKYNDALKRTAAHTVDRHVLFNFITNFNSDKNRPSEVILEQIEVIDPETVEAEFFSERKEEKEPSKTTKTEIVEQPVVTLVKKTPEEVLELGKPIQFQKHEPHSFNEWMQLISKKPIKRTPTPKIEVVAPQKEVIVEATEEVETPVVETPVAETPVVETPVQEQETPSKKMGQLNLIDKFIETNPKIQPIKKTTEIKDISKDSSEQNDSLMTETLAKVYIEQKKYDNAIQAYRILSLKYPEKSVFFADRIKAIKILQRNKS